ncbi:MAG: tetratricopeptide repeat protein [Chthoniobacteraceae bacterium]|nr:tetratricopeptide repeat protein [Chthoniobacteraceae bacterium]
MNSIDAEAAPGAPQQTTAPHPKIAGQSDLRETAPPPVGPVPGEAPRPFWSVMIPAYNPDPAYLAQTLKGVLAAGIGESAMQIEVVDDASTTADIAELVRSIAGGRVTVHRQPGNLGQRRNWNSCIGRARGEWVHLLHADDIVMPGFYAAMRAAIEANTGIGAAFCRHGHIRENGDPFLVSELEQPTPGILQNWPQRLAVMQRIQPPAIVVRRSVYEKLGGFWSAAGSCMDWEMWMRIAARYPVLYHPEILACYRVHDGSGTTSLRQTAAMTADCGRAIELFNAYLPAAQRAELMRLGKQHYARNAYRDAALLVRENNHEAAISHIDEALKLDPSPESVQLAEQIMVQLHAPQASGPATPGGDFFEADETRNIETLVAAYRQNPSDAAAAPLRALRQGLGDFLLHADPAGLQALFQGNFGAIYRLLLQSAFQNEPLSPEEQERVRQLASGFGGGSFDLRELLAFLLYRLAHHQPVPLELERIPAWFLEDYLLHLLHAPQGFMNPGEADQYYRHLLECLRSIERRTRTAPGAALTAKAALTCMERTSVIQLYFTSVNVKELMILRARIADYVLEKNGAKLNAKLPPRPANRTRIKVGFLNADLNPRVETYTTLPALYLDPARFEVCLFVIQLNETPLTAHCRAHASTLVELPRGLAEQVRTLRQAALDVLIIGTNITAVTNQVLLLAQHRLAPLQILNYNSPLTSGLRHIDGYLTGTHAIGREAQEHHTEKMLALEGVPNCLDFALAPPAARMRFERREMGINPGTVVFVSAATCYKIIPEMQETWARIIAAVPGSLLLLIPFNPNWSSGFPVKQFERSLTAVFARHGLAPGRFVLSPSLPNRAEVMELLKLGDIYLDTFPFTGSVSLIDPLALAIPPVVWEAETHRARLASSLLRDLGITDLISGSEDAYIRLAVRLAQDPALRRRLSGEIRTAMAGRPGFLDCARYGEKLGALLETLVLKRPPAPAQPPQSAEAPPSPAASEDPLQAPLRPHTGGHPAQAQESYPQIPLANPRNPDAWHLLGVLAHQCGNSESAVEFIEQALALAPQNPVFWNNLAEACNSRGLADKAIASSRRALELRPGFPEALVTLAACLRGAGDTAEALRLLAKALKLQPHNGDALLQQGLTLAAEKRFKEAIPSLKKACAAAPGSVEARYHLGVVCEESGRYTDALACYEKATQGNPRVGEVWHRWGKLLIGLQEFAKAEPVLREALRCNSADPGYHYQLGRALQMREHAEEALLHFDKAIELGGDTPELHNNRGILLKEKGEVFDAAESFHRALQLNPGMTSALNNLGAVCTDMGMTSEALECVQLLIARNSSLPSAHNNLGKLLKDSGRAAEALAAYSRALELNPSLPAVHDNFLLCLNYVAGRDHRENYEWHRRWGDRTARKISARSNWPGRNRDPERKLRVGYVSADLCQHPVAVFIEALLARHNRERIAVTAYADVRRPDAVTARLKPLVDRWRDTAELDDRALARQIENDQIDILVDLSGHTAWNRLEMFAHKPAPIQASYLGYPATTGLPAIDYRITDPFADPPGATEHLHTERLVRLPRCAWCFQTPEDAPPLGLRPSAQAGHITFGCFNQLAKLNPPLLDLWIRLLQRVPGSHLKLKAKTLRDPKVAQDMTAYFTERGIEATRLEISGFEVTQAAHLGGYQRVDIALDSFPYHGTTTTCEALWMGAPVVTLAGSAHVSRVGVSLLNAVGLPELIAANEEDYLAIAAGLAADEERRGALREGLRTRMLASPLMDAAALATAMDEAYRRMWQEYAEAKK